VAYVKGNHRLFYQSNELDPQTVVAKIITPLLKKIGPWEMTFIENGLYYLDVCFTATGSHVFYVYENGEQKHQDILVIDNGAGLYIYPNENTMI